ncbi:MAG: MucB/RseB C-terminal domain-containing protein [Halieaceae bacterium]|nr:MucB/RseB C-terminal domain-containing protein [Halieaceae bacterium]
MFRQLQLFALLSSMLVTALVQAAPPASGCPVTDAEALEWLSRMSHSLRETSYRGVFTYQQGGSTQAMRISHAVAGNVEHEQITRLSGDSVRVERTAHPLDCIHPGHRLVRLGDTYRQQGESCGLATSYDLRMAGTHRIAGRDAVIINVLPRDRFRYGYQIALDQETGLLLKTQTVAGDGRVLERFQFAEIQIGDAAGSGTDVELIHRAPHRHGYERPAAPATALAWSVNWLPEGFVITDDIAASGHNKTFTDGLANFSVFLEPLPQMPAPGAGMARQGGTTSYSRGVDLSGRPVLITVLGEIPAGTARQVADSVSWVTTQPSR